MYGLYLVLFLTTALFEKVICGVTISFCAPTITDLFPFPGNCTRYISCNRGQATIFSCTHGSTFNSELNQCDYKQRIDNCQNSIGNLKDLRISCPKGSSNSFPHPFDCKKYIACSYGFTYTMNCSSGTVYNPLRSVCDWRYNVPGCFGDLGNGVTLRGDVTLSLINLEIGSMNFESKKHVGNEHKTNQLIENENKLSNNQNYESHTSTNIIPSRSTSQPMRFPTEKPKNDEDENLDIDIRMKENESDDRSISEITRNGRAGTALSVDQVLAINNLAESEKMSNNTENDPSVNKLNKEEDHVGNEHETNQLIENENKLSNNQNYESHQTNKPLLENTPHYLQSADHKNHFTNKPTYHAPENSSNYLISNSTINHYSPLNYQTTPNIYMQPPQSEHYGVNEPSYHPTINQGLYSTLNMHPYQNQAASYQAGSKHNQVTGAYKPNTSTNIIPSQSTSQPIRFPTEKPKNDEDENLDIDIRMKENESDDRSISKITRNGRTGTTLPFDQVLAINNLAESEKMSNNTENDPSANKLNKEEDHVGLSSELHARIVNSPNNWFNGKPLEPINNYIDESRITEQVDDNKLVTFKGEIESVSSTTSETPSIKIIVENSSSINLLNYDYIDDYNHGSVKIDQNYSKIRNHTVSFTVNNNNVREGRSIHKLNHKSMGLKKLFSDNSTDDISFSTLFVTPFKSEVNNQHVEVINQLSGQVLRLKGESSAHRGYVEIRGIGLIGQCDNSWNLNRAHKICKKLGYKRGAKIIWKGQTNLAELPLLSLESDVFCQDDKSEFQICTFKNTSKCSTERDTIGVECFLDSPAYCSKNEVPFHRNCYHLVNSSLKLDHEEAIQYCSSRNSSLLYITAQNENDFISEWLTQKYPQVESIMTAGIGFTTMARTIWVWQDSEKSFFNFMKWWPGWKNEKILPPSAKSSASCIVMKNKFPCYDQPNLNCKTDGYFFWDVEDCTSSMKGNHYICKRPYNNFIL